MRDRRNLRARIIALYIVGEALDAARRRVQRALTAALVEDTRQRVDEVERQVVELREARVRGAGGGGAGGVGGGGGAGAGGGAGKGWVN